MGEVTRLQGKMPVAMLREAPAPWGWREANRSIRLLTHPSHSRAKEEPMFATPTSMILLFLPRCSYWCYVDCKNALRDVTDPTSICGPIWLPHLLVADPSW